MACPQVSQTTSIWSLIGLYSTVRLSMSRSSSRLVIMIVVLIFLVPLESLIYRPQNRHQTAVFHRLNPACVLTLDERVPDILHTLFRYLDSERRQSWHRYCHFVHHSFLHLW